MTRRLLLLALGSLIAGCSDAPLGPEAAPPADATTPVEIAPQAAIRSGSWTRTTVLWNGVSIWYRDNDANRVTIGLGKLWGKIAAYQGTNGYRLTEQRVLFEWLAHTLGRELRLELEEAVPWFNRVRDGKSVGLWIQVYAAPDLQNPSRFFIVTVAQRPKGSMTVPW